MLKKRRCETVLTLVAIALFVLTASAGATPIPIVNASFEDQVLANDDWTWSEPPYSTPTPGWTQVGTEGHGVWNPRWRDFNPVVAPDGQNVLYTENSSNNTPSGVGQILTETFSANTDYTLTASVGNSDYYWWSGYSVQLLAGGTVIAEDNNTQWPEWTKWTTSTAGYTYDQADAGLVGQQLEIRLLNLGIDMDGAGAGTVGVEFDAVSLNAGPVSPVPEPATMLLLGSGLLGLAGFRRKFKK